MVELKKLLAEPNKDSQFLESAWYETVVSLRDVTLIYKQAICTDHQRHEFILMSLKRMSLNSHCSH